jgi:hypothetical protein
MLKKAKSAVVSLSLFGVGLDALAEPAPIQGTFTVFSMAHTSKWPGTSNVNPWDGKSNGAFVYASASCSAPNAPINNASSDLPSYNTRIPGSRVPSSTRAHDLHVKAHNGNINGTIELTVCQLAPGPTSDGLKDSDRDRIFFKFTATPNTISSQNATFKGDFKITGGTGRYSDLTGEGQVIGYFFCFNQKDCEGENGRYRDVQFSLQGTYFDPTGPK